MFGILLVLALAVLLVSWFSKSKSVTQRAFSLMALGLVLLPLSAMAQTNVAQLVETAQDTFNSVYVVLLVITGSLIALAYARKLKRG